MGWVKSVELLLLRVLGFTLGLVTLIYVLNELSGGGPISLVELAKAMVYVALAVAIGVLLPLIALLIIVLMLAIAVGDCGK